MRYTTDFNDKLERYRVAETESSSGFVLLRNRVKEAEAELRASNEQWQDHFEVWQAEVARLREALERIAVGDLFVIGCQEVARAALTKETP